MSAPVTISADADAEEGKALVEGTTGISLEDSRKQLEHGRVVVKVQAELDVGYRAYLDAIDEDRRTPSTPISPPGQRWADVLRATPDDRTRLGRLERAPSGEPTQENLSRLVAAENNLPDGLRECAARQLPEDD